jgi:hypothetical protein
LLVLNSAPEISGSAAKPSLISTISGQCLSISAQRSSIHLFLSNALPSFFQQTHIVCLCRKGIVRGTIFQLIPFCGYYILLINFPLGPPSTSLPLTAF